MLENRFELNIPIDVFVTEIAHVEKYEQKFLSRVFFNLDLSQNVTGTISSDNFLAITTTGSRESSVVEVTDLSGDGMDVLDWDSMDSLDNLHNLGNWGFNDGGLGGGTGWWLGGASSGGSWGGGSWGGLNGGITNNAVAFIVSDVSHNVLNTISGSESKIETKSYQSTHSLVINKLVWSMIDFSFYER